MQKLITILIVILFSKGLYSQEAALSNKYVLGGSMHYWVQNNTFPVLAIHNSFNIGGIYSNSTNDTKNTSFALAPYFAKQFHAKLMLGLEFIYRREKYTANDVILFGQADPVDIERSSNQFGIKMFSRHYFNSENKFKIFGEPYIEYNSQNGDESQNSKVVQSERAHYIDVGIGAGVSYDFSDWIGATLRVGGLNYVFGMWENIDTNTKKDFSAFGTNLNFSTIYFGFEIKIK